MSLENIPVIEADRIKEQTNSMQALASEGTIPKWIDSELDWLSNNNPALYKYIIGQAQKFAMGAMMVDEPTSVALSQTVEMLRLLALVNACLKGEEELKKFLSMADDWGLSEDILKGLENND